jgi:hypothetical protein
MLKNNAKQAVIKTTKACRKGTGNLNRLTH